MPAMWSQSAPYVDPDLSSAWRIILGTRLPKRKRTFAKMAHAPLNQPAVIVSFQENQFRRRIPRSPKSTLLWNLARHGKWFYKESHHPRSFNSLRTCGMPTEFLGPQDQEGPLPFSLGTGSDARAISIPVAELFKANSQCFKANHYNR